MNFDEARAQFPVLDRLAYLNAGSMGPIARATVDAMVARLAKQDLRRKPSDDGLRARAESLSARHFGGRARPASIRWVGTMQSRWGSCTPTDGSIRISDRLRWVSRSRLRTAPRASRKSA